MADTIVLYAFPMHLNSTFVLAKFIATHHQSIHVTIVSAAPASAAASVAAVPSITYHPLANQLPQNAGGIEVILQTASLNPLLLEALQEISKKSTIRAFVLDFLCNPAYEVSRSLNIPTYFYFSSGGFGLCMLLYFPVIHEILGDDLGTLNDFIEVPGCPRIHSSDFPAGLHFRQSKIYKHFLDTAINLRGSDGIIVNSFAALELRAKDALCNHLCTPNAKSPPAYFIGPLIGDEDNSSGARKEHDCLKWLDLQPTKSVVYLCFGRDSHFSTEQLREMAVGLENCGHRFLWVVRLSPEEGDLNAILPEGFLQRTRDRGFVETSWAPQTEILNHQSIAGFVTHCGFSSTLEAVSFGVPMICWPQYAEQRMNREFMVEEMKVAMRLEAAGDEFVTAAEIEKCVRELMESEKGNQLRERVKEMKNAGKAAVQEGGSSLLDLDKFFSKLVI